MISDTLVEDLVSNAILLIVGVGVVCLRDFCKRVSQSDCIYDPEHGGLKIKLPTFRDPEEPEQV